MSLLKTIETIGSDILKGVEVAGQVITAIDPPVGAIITAVGAFITKLEGSSATPSAITAAQLSQIVQAIAMIEAINQAPAAAAPVAAPTPVSGG